MRRDAAYRPALDGLRAFAIAAVVLYHLDPRRLPGGFLGVDLFFVLSGYLITGGLLDRWERHGRVDLVDFWVRRARRILPALLLVLVAVALAVRRWEPAGDWHVRQGELFGALLYYANWHMVLAQQSYFAAVASSSALGHMWSLAIEEQFYLVWPLALAGLLRWVRRRSVIVAALIVCVAASAVAMVCLYTPENPTRAYAGTDARAQQLLIGALLVFAMRYRPAAGRWGAAGWGGVSGAVTAVVSVGLMLVVAGTRGFYYHGGATLVAVVFAALIWTVERLPTGALARVLAAGPVRWVGALSYGVYLWHLPVMRYLPQIWPWSSPPWVRAVASVAVTVLLATLSYYLVERPVRDGWARLGLGAADRVAAAGCAGVAFCATVVLISTSWASGVTAQQLAAADRAAGGVVGQRDAGAGDQPCPDTVSICVRIAARPGHPTVAVLGDSAARSLDPGFFDLARRNGWGYILAAHNGCGLTGMLNVDGAQPKPFMRACADQTPARIRQVLDEYHPDLVIALSRWELIAHLNPSGGTVTPMSPQWAQDVHAGMRSFAQAVVRSGARLALLAVLPLAPDGPECARGPRTPACTAVPDPLTAATNVIYRRVRQDVPGVSVVSMDDVVCPADQCRLVVDGLLVRFDGQHFTSDGARWFVQRLQTRLPEAVVRPGG